MLELTCLLFLAAQYRSVSLLLALDGSGSKRDASKLDEVEIPSRIMGLGTIRTSDQRVPLIRVDALSHFGQRRRSGISERNSTKHDQVLIYTVGFFHEMTSSVTLPLTT